ncbi:hypothetical protein JCM10296v2_003146 [Rhodotorula toruloides]
MRIDGPRDGLFVTDKAAFMEIVERAAKNAAERALVPLWEELAVVKQELAVVKEKLRKVEFVPKERKLHVKSAEPLNKVVYDKTLARGGINLQEYQYLQSHCSFGSLLSRHDELSYRASDCVAPDHLLKLLEFLHTTEARPLVLAAANLVSSNPNSYRTRPSMALPSLEPDLVQTVVAQALHEQGVEADEAAVLAAKARRYYLTRGA